MTDTMDRKILKGILGLMLWLPMVAYSGFIFSTLWGWFVVPTFSMAPDITFKQATGLNLIFTWITTNVPPEKIDQTNTYSSGERLLFVLVLQTAILGMGWVYHIVFF